MGGTKEGTKERRNSGGNGGTKKMTNVGNNQCSDVRVV